MINAGWFAGPLDKDLALIRDEDRQQNDPVSLEIFVGSPPGRTMLVSFEEVTCWCDSIFRGTLAVEGASWLKHLSCQNLNSTMKEELPDTQRPKRGQGD